MQYCIKKTRADRYECGRCVYDYTYHGISICGSDCEDTGSNVQVLINSCSILPRVGEYWALCVTDYVDGDGSRVALLGCASVCGSYCHLPGTQIVQ